MLLQTLVCEPAMVPCYHKGLCNKYKMYVLVELPFNLKYACSLFSDLLNSANYCCILAKFPILSDECYFSLLNLKLVTNPKKLGTTLELGSVSCVSKFTNPPYTKGYNSNELS